MDAVVDGLKDEGEIEEDICDSYGDLYYGAVRKVIEGMKNERKMSTNQVAYIRKLVRRARAFTKS